MTADLQAENEALKATLASVQEQLTNLEKAYKEARLIIERAPVGIAVGNADAEFTAVNAKFTETTGYTLEELPTFDVWWHKAYPDPDYRVKARTEWEASAQTAQGTDQIVGPQVWQIMHKDNAERYIDFRATFIADQIVTFFTDVSEQQRTQQQLIEAQQAAIQQLSTPVIPITEGVIVLPLVGSIDSERTKTITRNLLAAITQYRARTVILDITGVEQVDSEVAGALDRTIQAVRLKGAKAVITGISDAIAETIVDLGIDWSQLETVSNLQTALTQILRLTPSEA